MKGSEQEDGGKIEGIYLYFKFAKDKFQILNLFIECLKELFVEKQLGRLGDDSSCIHEVAKIIETASVDINVDVRLHEACGLDISKFCRDTATGKLRNAKNIYVFRGLFKIT